MKILFLIDSLGSGGAQRQMVTIAVLLKKRGYDIKFLIYHNYNFFQDTLTENKIEVIKIDAKGYLDRIIKIRKFIRKGDFDVVISFLETPNFLNTFSAFGGKKWKVITSERSAKVESFHSSKVKIYNFFQRYADAIVCNSENAKQLWTKYYPKYANKLYTIHNTVSLPQLNSSYKLKVDNKINIVIAASYQYLKSPLLLANAINMLSNEDKDKILINWYGRKEVSVGNTMAYDETKEFIINHKLENIFLLHEETKDIAYKMNQADFVGLFSLYEGMPNAICEAMLIGKPIIMSKVSDYEILVDKSNGLLVEVNDVHSIYENLLKIIKLKEDTIIQMGNNSKLKAQKCFSEEVIINKWLKIINN